MNNEHLKDLFSLLRVQHLSIEKVIFSIGLGKANIVLFLKTVDLGVSDSLGGHRKSVV